LPITPPGQLDAASNGVAMLPLVRGAATGSPDADVSTLALTGGQ
jgi:hypothetical protein